MVLVRPSYVGPDLAHFYTLQDPYPETGAKFGWSLGVSDVNGDGNDDVVVGAPRSKSARGEGFVFLWSVSPRDNPAVFVYPQAAPNKIYLAFEARGTFNRLNIMVSDGLEWMLTPPTQPLTYPYSPAMTSFQDKLWVATTAHPTSNSEPIMLRTFDGNEWSGPTPSPNYTIGGVNPAMASLTQTGPLRVYSWLFLFWQTPENNIYGTAYEAIDGWLMEPFAITTDPTTQDSEPTAAVYDQLYVAWVSNDTILCRTFNGTGWSPVNPNPVQHSEDPSLAVHDGLLYLAYTAAFSPSRIYIQTFDGVDWSVPSELEGSKPSSSPTICSHNELLYLTYVSQSQLYYQTFDEENWSSPPTIIPEFSNLLASFILVAALTYVILITKKTSEKRTRKQTIV